MKLLKRKGFSDFSFSTKIVVAIIIMDFRM